MGDLLGTPSAVGFGGLFAQMVWHLAGSRRYLGVPGYLKTTTQSFGGDWANKRGRSRLSYRKNHVHGCGYVHVKEPRPEITVHSCTVDLGAFLAKLGQN